MGSIVSRILGAPRFIPAIDVEALASQAQSKHSACPAHLSSRATLPPALDYMSSLPPPAPPSNRFVLFTKLPVELQLMIWQLALPGERIVRIQEFTESSTHNTIRRAYQCIGSKARVPTLLHVCHESRTLALKHYTMTLENRLLKPAYFNPDIDVLLFASFSDLFKFTRPDDLFYSVKFSKFLNPGFYDTMDTHNPLDYPPRASVNEGDIENQIRSLAIGWSQSVAFNIINDFTPWEEISEDETLDLIGRFNNLDRLLVEDIYFEQVSVVFPAPLLADQIFKSKLMQRWKERQDSARPFPEIKFLGPTKMKQMRSQAREARLYSGQRLGSIRRYMSRLHR